MELQVVERGQLSAPRIINDDRCAKLGGLHDGLNFATILGATTSSFCEEKVDSALFIAVAALEKIVSIEEESQTIFRRSTFEQILSDSFWHEHT
jgi:hypothetical protein